MDNIGIDLDGVISNTYPMAFEYLKKMYPNEVGKDSLYVPGVAWDKAYGLKRSQFRDFFIELGNEGVFREVPVFKDAKESLKRISEYYNILIISWRDYIPNSEEDTLYWLEKNKVPFCELILTKNKYRVAIEKKLVLFLDDGYKMCNKVVCSGTPTYFYLRNTNKHTLDDLQYLDPLVKVVKGWKDIENILIKKEKTNECTMG